MLVNPSDRLIAVRPESALVTVVIPVYNRSGELRRAIQSILNQTYRNFELIIVDDGSEEDLKKVCDSFKDDRIRFLRNTKHTNANVARNRGLKEAKGEYIAMLDSDDEFLPHHLTRRIQKIQEWDCDGIFGSAYISFATGQVLLLSRPLNSGESMVNYLLSDGSATTITHMYKSKAAQNVLWDETLERHQDYDFCIRFSNKYRFVSDYEPTTLIHWEVNNLKEVNLESCVEFIKRYKDSISGKIYNEYHRGMYFLLADTGRKKYINYYKLNSYKYISYVSFNDFLLVHPDNKRFKVLIFIKFAYLYFLYFLRMIAKLILKR